MTKAKPSFPTGAAAERQLKGFIAKFDATNQALIKSARRVLQRRLPTAVQFIYDNYNFFVIGFGPNDRPSDAILSIAAGANGVGLCFIHGARLPDPDKVLTGSGKQTRFVRLPTVSVLAQPAVKKLLNLAVAKSRVPMPARGRGAVIVRSVSAKQRPRRRKA